MIQNYIKIAWRNLLHNKVLSVINLLGLSIGIAAVIMIAVYINFELGFDNFHRNESNLYRVGIDFWQDGKLLAQGETFISSFGPDARNELPEINSFVRISTESEAYVSFDDITIKVTDIRYADSAFFKVFSFELLKGNPKTVLTTPYSIVLTQTTANKLFNNREPLGNIVKLSDNNEYMVTGVAMDPPANSHIDYNALISFSTLYKDPGNHMGWNGGNQYITYLLLNDGVKQQSLQGKFPDFMWKHINEGDAAVGFRTDASLQPIKDIHLRYSNDSVALRTNIYVFTIIAIFILIISSINYINLTTAQSAKRIKEIGVRKILGAHSGQIVKQFLGETFLTTLIAGLIAILLVVVIMPVYGQFFGKNIGFAGTDILVVLLFLFVIIIVVSLVAGSYVAFYLSSLSIGETFKSAIAKSSFFSFKKGLIVLQFSITIGLVASTAFITLQLHYTKTKDPGFNKDQILVLPLIGTKAQESYSLLRQQILQIPEIKEVTGLSEIPFDGITQNGFIPEEDNKAMVIHQLDADEGFLKTFNIRLKTGNFFSDEKKTLKNGYVINETLAKMLGWEYPVGKTIRRDGLHKVIGVVKDFHFASLHDKLEPLIITNQPWDNHYSFLAVKFNAGQALEIKDKISHLWGSLLGGSPFEYWFLDDAFDSLYKSEEKFQQIFSYFTALSIILSLAGIFGLVLLMLQQRTKEMGIRKVLGASINDILKIVIADFIWLIIVAAIIATPITWYYINSWLQNFAYSIAIEWWVFAFTTLVILIIVLLTIGIQTVKVALSNPVNSLRTE
jgi:putative ABC transport system permease protein